jgi:GTP-binding protein
MAAVEGRDPISDYHVINEELAQYSKALQERPRIIVANKMDIPEAANHLARFKEATGEELLEMSAATGKGLKELGLIIFETLNKQELT